MLLFPCLPSSLFGIHGAFFVRLARVNPLRLGLSRASVAPVPRAPAPAAAAAGDATAGVAAGAAFG